ncbi:hypothetical protein CURTO8I2_150106 [Curtobacterium sp. 8I-2]|nr:hypothetical protein CURTO8I2_150106 [Curtobacterium sp. 8I-2]
MGSGCFSTMPRASSRSTRRLTLGWVSSRCPVRSRIRQRRPGWVDRLKHTSYSLNEISSPGKSALRLRITATWARNSASQAATAVAFSLRRVSLTFAFPPVVGLTTLPTGSDRSRATCTRAGHLSATGPLPCTKSFLQSHSAGGATANTVCTTDCITKR